MKIEIAARRDLPEAGETLAIFTWNLGYAGLGAGSDFKADGGAHVFPPSRRAARANADAIADVLRREDADIVLLEELAHAGPINYWVNLKTRVDAAMSDRARLYASDFKTLIAPWPIAMDHGQGVYTRRAFADAEAVPLPGEAGTIFGAYRHYKALASRLAGQQNWTVASVHLAAFDPGAATRTRQLRDLLAWAEREYQCGRRVVIGGDFNLRLAETDFPNTTDSKFLFWLYPFPFHALPAGWRLAADASTPSVRTNERPYIVRQNYTTVIDGFIVSPNVAVEAVRGVDLGFANSDHNPVRVRVRAL